MIPPLLYCRIEATALIGVVGVNGTNTDATFAACQFGNGGYVGANADVMQWAIPTLDNNEHVIELYITTDFGVANGQPDDATTHVTFTVESDGGNEGYLGFVNANGIWFIHNAGGWGGAITEDATSDWTALDKIHVLAIRSRSASFDGAKTSAIYINGVETDSDTTALDDRGVQANTVINVGNVWAADLDQPFDGQADNLFIHNGVASVKDFATMSAHRHGERRNLNDQ